MLLVVCVEKKVERSARRLLHSLPFKSPGLVLGIDQLQEWVPDSREIRAVLKAVAYLKSDGTQDPRPILDELAHAGLNDPWRPLRYALILKVLERATTIKEFKMDMFKDANPEMIKFARELLGPEIGQSKAEGVEIGKAVGVRAALLQILSDRGITLSAVQHAKLEAADLDTALGWLRQATNVQDGQTLFEPN